VEGREQPDEHQRPKDGRDRHVSKLAEGALEQHGLQGARVAYLESKGRGKLLFRVDAPASRRHPLHKLLFRADASTPERFLLRLHERHTISEASLRSEMLWLRDLRRESDLLVPEPIPDANGSFVSRVRAEGSPEPRLCVLTRWVPGINKTPHLVSEDLFSAGSQIAQLHRHSERYAVPEGFVRPYPYDWERVFGEESPLWNKSEDAYSQGQLEVFRVAAERTCHALRELGEERDVFGLIHSDPTPNNFVFQDGEARVIDFASCGWGHYLYDVAVALSALEAHGEHRAGLRAAFLEGYRRERPIPEGHLGHLGAFRTMRLARRVATVLDRGDPARQQWGPARFSKVVERIEKYVASDGGVERMDLGPP
jgi:Ser/Thr protein kinase RdoA (MazF antagonist)